MVDHIDDASEPRGRVDIRVGVGRRRRWSVATKGRIVAESYAPGAVVSEVARRHDMSPQHLFGWRKAARAGLLTLPADEVPMFVPIVREARDDGVAAAVGVTVSGVIRQGWGHEVWTRRARPAGRSHLLCALRSLRLEHGAFRWPPVSDGVMRLTAQQLAALVDGMDWSRLHARDVARPTATS